MKEDNYLKYRGKCLEICQEMAITNPSLTLIRGYYYCPFWGKQQHWWLKKENGEILDPTVKQFPSHNIADASFYEEFDGVIHCAECGKEWKEEEAYFYGNYAFCPDTRCAMSFVGL